MQEIGLKKGTVKLKQHNANWAKLFEKEKKLLLKKFPNIILEISHGGSTAIPNIPAKPIIDMFAVVSSLKTAESLKNDLKKLGYEYHGNREAQGRILYVKGNNTMGTHHLHLVKKTDKEWKHHLLIKKYFLKYPNEVMQYAKLKKELAKQYPADRKAYTDGKDAFIKSIIKKTKKEKGI